MRRRAVLRLLPLLTFGVFGWASCLSPTLPLPPPDSPDTVTTASDAEGEWRVSGTCTPGTRVTLLNEVTGRGAVFEDRESAGRYDVTIKADRCDVGSVTQAFADDPTSLSASTRFVFQQTSGGTAKDPSECR